MTADTPGDIERAPKFLSFLVTQSDEFQPRPLWARYVDDSDLGIDLPSIIEEP
jgi:hypothetical protein